MYHEKNSFINKFYYKIYDDHRDLHSFPTRRSSDLGPGRPGAPSWGTGTSSSRHGCWPGGARSEEHTSELQSQFQLVCRLLLEKKNNWRMKATLVMVFGT